MDNRGLLSSSLDEARAFEKSPITSGVMAGLKAALMGAPIGAGIQMARGQSATPGAILGALIPGLLAGFSAAGEQKIENLNTEAMMRYHANNIKSREPMFFMPPRQVMGKYFSRRFGG